MKEAGNRSLMGFDFGTKSIGIATGQEITGSASPLTSLKANGNIPDWAQIEKLLKEWRPDLLIVGLPLNMDGTEQEMAATRPQIWPSACTANGFQVEFKDERLTTTDAKARLFEHGGYRALGKSRVDAVSAQLILESWMESHYGAEL